MPSYRPVWKLTIDGTDYYPVSHRIEMKINEINRWEALLAGDYSSTFSYQQTVQIYLNSWLVMTGVIEVIETQENGSLTKIAGHEVGVLLDNTIFEFYNGQEEQEDAIDVFLNEEANKILDKVLPSNFSIGACPTDVVSVEFNGLTRLQCIKKLAKILGKDWWVDNYTVYIGDKGSSKGTLQHYRIVKSKKDYSKIVNRIYLRRPNGGRIIVPGTSDQDYVEDATSISTYGLMSRVYTVSNSMDDETAVSEAEKLLDELKDPKEVIDIRVPLSEIEDLQLTEGDTVTVNGTDYRIARFTMTREYEVRMDMTSVATTITDSVKNTQETVAEHSMLLTKIWDLDKVPGSLIPRGTGKNLGRSDSPWHDAYLSGTIYGPSKIQMAGTSHAWRYAAPITVTNASTTETYTDVHVEITYTFSSGEVQSDGSDVVFAEDEEGTSLLNFWRKSWNSSTLQGTFIVKIPQIDAGDSITIYMLWGNSSVSDRSSMENTLIYTNNILSNGTFESAEADNTPTDWTTPVSESEKCHIALVPHSGDYCAELGLWNPTSSPKVTAGDMKQTVSGTFYGDRFTLYYRNDGSDTAKAVLYYKDGSSDSVTFGTGKTSYTYLVISADRSKAVDYVYIDRSTDSDDRTFVDDAALSGWYENTNSDVTASVGTKDDRYSVALLSSSSHIMVMSESGSESTLFSVGTYSPTSGASELFKVNNQGVITSESVTPDSIKVASTSSSPSNGDVLVYEDGEFKWDTVSSGGSDTYKVMADSGDSSPDYLSGKVDSSTIIVNGSDKLEVVNSPKWNSYSMSDNLTLGGDVSTGGDLKVGSNHVRDSSGAIRLELGSTVSVDGALDVDGMITGTKAYLTAGESRFSLSAYSDPDSGVGYAIKVGDGGIAVNGDSLFNNAVEVKGNLKVSSNNILMSSGRNAFNFDAGGLQINTWNNFMIGEAGTSNSTVTTYDSYKQKFRGTYWDGSNSQTFDAEWYLNVYDTHPYGQMVLKLDGATILKINNGPQMKFGISGYTNRFYMASKDSATYAGLYTVSSSNRIYVRAENTDDVAEFASYGIYLPRNTTYGVYVGGGIELAYADSGKRLDFLKTPSYISYGNGNVIFTIQDPLILHRKMEPNVDNSKELGTWSSKRWYSVNTYRVKTVHINCNIDQDLNIFYNSPNVGSRILRIGRHASDSSHTSYDSPKLRMQGSYWDGSQSRDSYWDIWNDVSTSSAILKFDYLSSNKMWLRHDGKLWLSGYLQLGNNQIMDSGGTVRVTVGSTTTINGDLKVSGNDILDSGGTKRITLGSTTSIWGYNYVNIYNTKYSSSTPMMKIYYDTAKRVQIYTHWLTVEENNTSDKLGVTFKTTGSGQCPGFYWEYAYTSPRHIVREWFRGDLSDQRISWEWYNGSSYTTQFYYTKDGKGYANYGWYTFSPKFTGKDMIELLAENAKEFLKREAPRKDDGTFDDSDMQLIEDELPGGEKTYRVEYSQKFLDKYAKDISKMAIISSVLINFLISLLVRKGIIRPEDLKKLVVK